jgi:hypothetical protein
MKFYIGVFFENLSVKFQFHSNMTRINCTSYKDWRTFMIILNLAHFFLEWKMFQTKVVEKIKTYFVFNRFFFLLFFLLWDNVGKFCTARQPTDDNRIRRMRFACWIIKATNTHSEYVILIAFPPQQYLLLHTPQCYIFWYVARLVKQRNSLFSLQL